jgi:small-conductance mechanosensitive channel
MTIRRTWLTIGRQFVLWSLTGAFLVASAVLDRGPWGQPSETASIDSIKSSLDEIEAAIGRDDVTAEALSGARQSLNSAAEALRSKIDELEPRAREAEERLKQLGPEPAKDAPPESPEIANEREELTTTFSELDGALKQVRVLSVRIDQLGERVAQKRHALYASELFARTASVLDPFFWLEASQAVPIEMRRVRSLFETWVIEGGDRLRSAAAAFILLGIATVAIGMSRWWFPRLSVGPYSTRSEKAWAALRVFIWLAARTPAASFAALLVLDAFGLLTTRLDQIAHGLIAGVAAAAFGHGVARGLFAPENPERRLVQQDDETARCFHNHLVWASRALGVVIALQVMHKTLFARH